MFACELAEVPWSKRPATEEMLCGWCMVWGLQEADLVYSGGTDWYHLVKILSPGFLCCKLTVFPFS